MKTTKILTVLSSITAISCTTASTVSNVSDVLCTMEKRSLNKKLGKKCNKVKRSK